MDPVRVQRRARGSARGIGRGRRGHRTRRGAAPCLPAPRRAARRSPRRGVHVFQTGSAQRARWNVVRLRRSTDFLCKNAHVFPFFFRPQRGALEPVTCISSTHVKVCTVVWPAVHRPVPDPSNRTVTQSLRQAGSNHASNRQLTLHPRRHPNSLAPRLQPSANLPRPPAP
jgi:hypothetical protein